METPRALANLLHWTLAILPSVVLLAFLVPLHRRAPEAGPMAMFPAATVAVIPLYWKF